MTNSNNVIDFLKSFGWTEDRCVDVSNFRFGLNDEDMQFIGDKFYMFDKATEFLQSFGGLNFKWKLPNDTYNYVLKINGNSGGLGVSWLKWYIAYLRKMLYPVASYPAMPGDLLIDNDGNFYFVNEVYISELGNDFLEILATLFNGNINAISHYKRIPDWEEAGYSDEFIEQWNYDFDVLDKQ